MKCKNQNLKVLLLSITITLFLSCTNRKILPPQQDKPKTAKQYFEKDYQWYIDNVPFFECSDREMEAVYYYRWKLYKAHIRNTGKNEFVITEFINHVPWDREPYCTINAASMHHIYEGRWLKDDRYMNGYINNLYNGGNNRSYSESVADAMYARFLVNADSAFIIRYLDSAKAIFNAWYDHYDSSKNLYYIPAMPDATEYTVASIDASGGKDGFEGGDAFRPTINSYMYGNAKAIARIAEMTGDEATASLYSHRAADLKKNVEENLWNDSLQHFTDRFKVNNQYVKYWDFIRNRELAGIIPWYFNLPADKAKFSAAWEHIIDTGELLGTHGFRTNEPAYEYYFKQFVLFEGKPGSQWNGPSWPYQSSQALTAMANLLNNYQQDVVNVSDYVKLLRLFTKQHILPNGKINLVENYDPDKGGPIVYYYWSNHYLHSSYNNLVISGLCGIRPSESDSLVVNPLVDSTIDYFMLSDVNYHGHRVTVVFDRDGKKYNIGKGLSVFVDGQPATITEQKHVYVGAPVIKPVAEQTENFALNIARKGFPKPSASVNSVPDTSMFQAIDGRIWYFPEIINYWSSKGSTNGVDWYAVDFGRNRDISSIKIYLFADDATFFAPDSITVEYLNRDSWTPVVVSNQTPAAITANTQNVLQFDKISGSAIRLNFKHSLPKQVAFSEIECY
ncbi:MAG: discoidin domain-containing protein [Chitinophagaceae bacterium]|nr:discoidin domain-containing protein [Chitinophagaceae bacterium]